MSAPYFYVRFSTVWVKDWVYVAPNWVVSILESVISVKMAVSHKSITEIVRVFGDVPLKYSFSYAIFSW